MVEREQDFAVEVAVIGAGVVGLGIAWAAANSGRTVAIIDPDPAGGATYAAAGMLAPVSELHYQEESLLGLMLASSELYPAFIQSLDLGDDSTGYRRTKTISVGVDSADRRALADLQTVQLANGLQIETLTIRAARELEPLLSPQLSGAFLARGDHQVDPRKLAESLIRALNALSVAKGWVHPVEIRQRALGVLHENPADAASAVTGVRLADGSTISAREVIVANGLAADQLEGLPDWLALPLRPVYGDILRLRVPENLRPLLTCTLRGVVHGEPIYLVPRSDGTVVIGASQREDGSSAASAGNVFRLLRDAQALVPAVSELELIEVTCRARPGTLDNAPLLGRVAIAPGEPAAQTHAAAGSAAGATPATGHIPGLIIATGFYRHGVLLTPIAAQYCLELIEERADDRWSNFRPDRFCAPPAVTANPPATASPAATANTAEDARP